MSVVLVTGASGFIGSSLCPALVEAGHDVCAMTRHPDTYSGAGTPVEGDVSDPASLVEPMAGVDVAYYLVHSLGAHDFAARDAAAAHAFAAAAAAAGVDRIVYLGGLGDDGDDLSPHLRSRREVEQILAAGPVPVTVLRAAVVIGHGGISWEITRQLVDHLPAMIAPRWVETRTQPIALPDVVRYLVAVLGEPATSGRVFEIGGPDVLRYKDMMVRAAKIQNRRGLPVFTVPLFTPHLSSYWLWLVTDVDVPTATNLIDSMTTEVVVHDHAIEELLGPARIGYEESVRLALAVRAQAQGDDSSGPSPS